MVARAVVFDVGNVLYHWSPRDFYKRLIPDDQALDAFLANVVTMDWHAQHDAGRPFAQTSVELIALHPQHRDLILAWGSRFNETITGPVAGMAQLVDHLVDAGVPVFGITNFAAEFWHPFRAQESALFDRFQDIVVSGVERLSKPNPAIYQLALNRFGLADGEGLFVDDLLINVEAARANGLLGHHFHGAPLLIEELKELGLIRT